MVTINTEKWMSKSGPTGQSTYYREGECLSTDTKPTTGWSNGSKLIEMDTGTLYIYDAENSTWRAWA